MRIFLALLLVLSPVSSYAQLSDGDNLGLVPNTGANVQIFTPTGTNTNSSWQKWYKPRGASMVYMHAIGSGAGGGGGFTRASGAAGGGGGGGAAATASCLIPAMFVPDTLYVQAAQPGLGGAANSPGQAGQHSYVSIGAFPAGTVASMITHQQVFLHSGILATPAGAGGAGTVAVGGPAGAAGGVATAALNTLCSNMGFWKATIGKVGFIGGFGAAGTAASNVLSASTTTTSGGAGGGGANAANTNGGNQTGAGIFQTVSGGTAQGLPGGSGLNLFGNSTGGAGGFGSAAGVGSNGGNGGIGSGGGGGGSGTTGGSGGHGGPGRVIIISW